jgi:hypothetical protein
VKITLKCEGGHKVAIKVFIAFLLLTDEKFTTRGDEINRWLLEEDFVVF